MSENNQETKSRRGFANLDAERRREIASQGGRAAHQQGVAHQWNSEEAAAAGKKGGQASRRSREKDRGEEIL